MDPFTIGLGNARGALAKGCDGADDLVQTVEALGPSTVVDAVYARLKINAGKHRAACLARDMTDVSELRALCAEAMNELKRR